MTITTTTTSRKNASGTAMLSIAVVLITTTMTTTAANIVTIHNFDDFDTFASNVNSGTNYKGTTVYLSADIDFTDMPTDNFPIGKVNTASKTFRGTFDGQGHIINNLQLTSSAAHVGLFGTIANGTTIRNLVIGDNCTFKSTYDSLSYVAGIVAYAGATVTNIVIENVVNMAKVISTGKNANDNFFLGGIIGYCGSEKGHACIIKNAANYGNIKKTGEGNIIRIGGIVGYCSGESANVDIGCSITNSLSTGKLTYKASSSGTVRIGGIVGRFYYRGFIKNCVNLGKVNYTEDNSERKIGAILGDMLHNSEVRNCYWNSAIGYDAVGEIGANSHVFDAARFNSSLALNKSISADTYFGASLDRALNSWATNDQSAQYSGWVMNAGKKNVTFVVNNTSLTVTGKSVILLPNLAESEQYHFDGWYTDKGMTERFKATNITETTTLYSNYREDKSDYTITFDTRGGSSVAPITAQIRSNVALPTGVVRKDHAFGGWETEDGVFVGTGSVRMWGHNTTLHAVWVPTHIRSAEDMNELSRAVNMLGVSLSGETVFLEADIDFSSHSGEFEPIGLHLNGREGSEEAHKPFLGDFDGQGHIIEGLVLASSTLRLMGLFGYSQGTSIRNVVLGRSCSITNDFSSTYYPDVSAVTAGILAYCKSSKRSCVVENSINIGNIRFEGHVDYNAILGGISGVCHTSADYECIIRNCANYGDISFGGDNRKAIVGGIAGYFGNTKEVSSQLVNNLNQGTFSGDMNYLGGIVGNADKHTNISNCVNGKAIGSELGSRGTGTIAGKCKDVTVTSCYWVEDDVTKHFGEASTSDATNTSMYYSRNLTLANDPDTTIIDIMNKNCGGGEEVRWISNIGRHNVTYVMDGHMFVSVSDTVILHPNLVNTDTNTFHGWFTDPYHAEVFTNNAIYRDITLYGNYTLPPSSFILSSSSSSSSSSSRFISNTVQITFTTKGLTEEMITDEIKKILNREDDKFTIQSLKNDNGELIAIVKFDDTKTAINFVEIISNNSDSNTIFKDATFIKEIISGALRTHLSLTLLLFMF